MMNNRVNFSCQVQFLILISVSAENCYIQFSPKDLKKNKNNVLPVRALSHLFCVNLQLNAHEIEVRLSHILHLRSGSEMQDTLCATLYRCLKICVVHFSRKLNPFLIVPYLRKLI